jgi:hypothetical protein
LVHLLWLHLLPGFDLPSLVPSFSAARLSSFLQVSSPSVVWPSFIPPGSVFEGPPSASRVWCLAVRAFPLRSSLILCGPGFIRFVGGGVGWSVLGIVLATVVRGWSFAIIVGPLYLALLS